MKLEERRDAHYVGRSISSQRMIDKSQDFVKWNDQLPVPPEKALSLHYICMHLEKQMCLCLGLDLDILYKLLSGQN